MRAFLAIPLPPATRDALAEIGKGIQGLRSQRADTIHLTLRFLGEIDDELEIVGAVTPVVGKHKPFDISLERIGVFPPTGAPRVVWVGLGEGEMQAGALAAGIETALVPLGFDREHRAWHGHVTLGRFRDPEDVPGDLIDREARFGEVRADQVVLYRSILRPDGASHEAVARMPLGGVGDVPGA